MNEQQQDAAILDLQNRVGALEGKSAPPPAPGAEPTKDSLSFYWDATGRWLDVSGGAGQEVSRWGQPAPGWAGTLEIAIGILAGNETDRIHVRVHDNVTKADVPWPGSDDPSNKWMNVNGFDIRVPYPTDHEFSVYVTGEKAMHVSVNCLHQP